ncbi:MULTISPECIES: COQ9 family protein [unclassified Meridianimarinicoccus]|uniref:COQ9 family protein n=1 Tax=unclassified Meridianimarinicoccus TaxID=2923344 RepID=UPI0018677D13|nr:COQ9 family protein [Fluviibacterium sp. MJW13]
MTQPTQTPREVKDTLLAAIEPHVPFDGWTESAFVAAVRESGIAPAVARGICPRGAVDLAVHYHKMGDEEMLRRIRAADMGEMKFREKVAAAVRFRLEAVTDREMVRRGATLFALPNYAADGARAVWDTVDAIWTALGDSSDDINWYTKRATLSAVYSSTVLYWLGDDSPEYARTWAFLDRRIEGVMQFEKFKAQVNKNPLLKPLFAGPNWALSWVKAPTRVPNTDLPGSWSEPRN